jgi:hypothetical protein
MIVQFNYLREQFLFYFSTSKFSDITSYFDPQHIFEVGIVSTDHLLSLQVEHEI